MNGRPIAPDAVMPELDPLLRRVERNAVVACAVMAAIAWAATRGSASAPAGVFGGGVLAWVSYRGIKGGIDVLTGTANPGVGVAIALVKFFTRYAILAFAAYVIMARFRMPPVAVIAGASSVVVAVAVEALSGSQWKS